MIVSFPPGFWQNSLFMAFWARNDNKVMPESRGHVVSDIKQRYPKPVAYNLPVCCRIHLLFSVRGIDKPPIFV